MNKRDAYSLILKCSSWSDFVSAMKNLDNTVDVGDAFERLTQLQMLTDPISKTQFANVWIAKQEAAELPERVRKYLNLPVHDEGIDLIAESGNRNDRRYTAIQVKYRSTGNLTWKDISTFQALAFETCTNIERGIIKASTPKPIAKKSLVSKRIHYELLDTVLSLDDDDSLGWKRIHRFIQNKPQPPAKRKRPRPYQRKAINAAVKYFGTNNSRGRLIMPCATGKSLIAYWISQRLESRTILLAVPSLALINQSLQVWSEQALSEGVEIEFLGVCSDDSAGVVEHDSFTTSIADVRVECTTDIDRIKTFLLKQTRGLKVVLSTYQSGEVLASASRLARRNFDLAIMDEAHKTVGQKDRMFSHLLFDENIKIKQRIFMTATERQFLSRMGREVVSMGDDSHIFGERFHQLTFKAAMEEEPAPISDYRIATIHVRSDEIREYWDSNTYLQDMYSDFEQATRPLASGIALAKAYQKWGITKAISFHRSIQRAVNFRRQQEALFERDAGTRGIDTFHISSKTVTAERNIELRRFAESDRSLITNARCLTEGVDIPAVDCVLFADPKRSVVDIVQATGRALRLSGETGKKYGLVLIPVIIPDGDTLSEVEEAYADVIDIVKRLATQDERIVEQLKARMSGGIPSGGIIEYDEMETDSIAVDFDQLFNDIDLELWEHVKSFAWPPYEEVKRWVREQGITTRTQYRNYDRPFDIPAAPETVYRGQWVSWYDFLGTVSPREHVSYLEAQAWAQSQHIQSLGQWRRTELPVGIPRDLHKVFRKEWVDIYEFLGTPRPAAIVSYREAKAWALSQGFISGGEYLRAEHPPGIPAAPDATYKDQWVSWYDFLDQEPPLEFVTYREARAWARASGIETAKSFYSARLPSGMTNHPDAIYKDEWVNWYEFLGTKMRAGDRRMRKSYEEVRAWVRSAGITSEREFRQVELPSGIPRAPNTLYPEEWVDWISFFGKERPSGHRSQLHSFTQARAMVRKMGFTKRSEYESTKLPPGLPSNPDKRYAGDWIDWYDFLGTPRPTELLSFEEAKALVQQQGIKSKSEFARHRPVGVPAGPRKTYKDQWISWYDFFGTPAPPSEVPFAKARKWARGQRFESVQAYKKATRPAGIPTNPNTVYTDKWVDWYDYLGLSEEHRDRFKKK